ncbi:MAG TPA: PAS domain S-box protein [Anaeromyxobacteraceae bacterium]|nr:PAS domain S-box protein [Anaeromyxobacteraceae bacterium]
MRGATSEWASPLTKLLFEDPKVGRCLVAPDGIVACVNGEWLRLMGVERDAIVGSDLVRLFSEDRGGARASSCETTVDTVPMEGGTGLLLTARAATRQAGSAFPLEGELRTLASLVENSGDFVGVCSLDLKPIFVNGAGRQMVGLGDRDVCETHVMDYFCPADRARIASQAIPALLRDGRWSGEVRFRNFATGEPIHTMWNVFTIRGDDGQPTAYATVSPNLDPVKRAEDALRDSEEQLRMLVQGVRDHAIFMLSPEGTVRTWNVGAERLKGYAAAEIVGQDFSHFYTEEDVAAGTPARALSEAGDRGRFEDEGWRVRKDGTRFWANVVITPFRDEAGRLRGFSKVVRDFSERHYAEKRLREQEHKYRSLFESSLDAVYVTRHDGTILDANPAACRMHGMSVDDIRARGRTGIVVNDERLTAALAEREVDGRAKTQLTFLRKDGTQFPVEIESVVVDPGGSEWTSFVIARDITEQKRAERELCQREEEALERAAELGAVLDAVPAAVFITHDRDARSIQANRFCAETLRIPAKFNPSMTAPAGERPQHFRLMRDGAEIPPEQLPVQIAAAEGREVRDYEMDVVFDDGETRKVFGNAAPLFDGDGRPSGAVGAFIDITQRRRAEDALRESEALYRSLFTLAPSGVVVTDETGQFYAFNDQAHEYLGYTREEFARLRISDLDPDASAEDVRRRVEQIYEAGSAEFDARHRSKSGEVRHVRARCRAVHLGSVRRLISVWQDVTERKEAEEALREADRRKSDFLAMLSHELRNPLAPIRNSAFLLEHAEPGSPEWTRAKAVIGRQSAHLTRIVDDLLDITRISRGKIELARKVLDVRDVVCRACDDHQATFDQRKIELRFEQPPRAVFVSCDPTRLTQVVGNLLHNAAKFTSAGGTTTVTVAEAGGQAEIRVRDTGVGITEDKIGRIFEPFVQGDVGLGRSSGGLGLGLAMVKGLIELHGGRAWARSGGDGRGAEFTVSLPADAVPPVTRASPRSERQVSRSVLVIEDQWDSAQTLADVLAHFGHRVEIALDGRSGLEMARTLRPEIVLCDVGLPDLNGYEIARALRSDPAFDSTRLVALTGYAQREDVSRAIAAGFHAHLAKPLDIDEIARALA